MPVPPAIRLLGVRVDRRRDYGLTPSGENLENLFSIRVIKVLARCIGVGAIERGPSALSDFVDRRLRKHLANGECRLVVVEIESDQSAVAAPNTDISSGLRVCDGMESVFHPTN